MGDASKAVNFWVCPNCDHHYMVRVSECDCRPGQRKLRKVAFYSQETVDELRFELSCLQQQYDERTTYTVTHRGAMLACSSAMRDAYADMQARAELAEAALAEMRARVEGAPSVEITRCNQIPGASDFDYGDLAGAAQQFKPGTRVRLVAEGEA